MGLDGRPLITERVSFENYAEIYDNIGKGNSIASLLVYDSKGQGQTPERSA